MKYSALVVLSRCHGSDVIENLFFAITGVDIGAQSVKNVTYSIRTFCSPLRYHKIDQKDW